MSATNKTLNYELPIFIDTDKPSWLGDWNGAMTKIDNSIKTIDGVAESGVTVANEALTTAEGAVTTANNALTASGEAKTEATAAKTLANNAYTLAGDAQVNSNNAINASEKNTTNIEKINTNLTFKSIDLMSSVGLTGGADYSGRGIFTYSNAIASLKCNLSISATGIPKLAVIQIGDGSTEYCVVGKIAGNVFGLLEITSMPTYSTYYLGETIFINRTTGTNAIDSGVCYMGYYQGYTVILIRKDDLGQDKRFISTSVYLKTGTLIPVTMGINPEVMKVSINPNVKESE